MYIGYICWMTKKNKTLFKCQTKIKKMNKIQCVSMYQMVTFAGLTTAVAP